MKSKLCNSLIGLASLALSALNLAQSGAQAQGAAFTYQGQLNSSGSPANGSYDMRFTLYDSTNTPGNIMAGPITNAATAVSNGLFYATLDFGAGPFNGQPRWLQIDVRTNGATSFTTLNPRQPLLPTPYAIMANSASNLVGSLPADQLSGSIPLSQLPVSVVTNGAIGVNLTGTFNGGGGNNNYFVGGLGITNTQTSGDDGTINTISISGIMNPNENTFIGFASGSSVTNGQIVPNGTLNVAVGWRAGMDLVSGIANTAVGADAQHMGYNTSHNTAVGHGALYANVSGVGNTALGAGALENFAGGDATACGLQTLQNVVSGGGLSAFGCSSLAWLTNGDNDAADGQQALGSLASGSGNSALGYAAGWSLIAGDNNIYIGNWGNPYEHGNIYLGTPGAQSNLFYDGDISFSSGGAPTLSVSAGLLLVNSNLASDFGGLLSAQSGFASYATNAAYAMTETGYTNTGLKSIRVFGFTGASVTFSNALSKVNFPIGTIPSPGQMLIFQPNESLTGTTCAAAGMVDF